MPVENTNKLHIRGPDDVPDSLGDAYYLFHHLVSPHQILYISFTSQGRRENQTKGIF
jgi:hypothetical protein